MRTEHLTAIQIQLFEKLSQTQEDGWRFRLRSNSVRKGWHRCASHPLPTSAAELTPPGTQAHVRTFCVIFEIFIIEYLLGVSKHVINSKQKIRDRCYMGMPSLHSILGKGI